MSIINFNGWKHEIKKILIAFILLTILASFAYAEKLDGYFWNELPREGKQRMVDDMRRGAMKTIRGVRDTAYFVKQLDDFYDATEPVVLKTEVSTAFSLICISGGVESKEP